METSFRQLGADVLPRISVIAVMPDCFQTIRKTVLSLGRQTIASALELIIVAPATADLRLDEQDFVGLHSHALVRIPKLEIMGVAREAGVRAARAPFVGFVEDHAYPEPDWAEALLASHAQGNVAVGALMINANPQGMTSWSDLFLGFAPYVEPRTGGPADRLPWHHTGYDRELLLSLGNNLSAMLETEGVLHEKLQSEGKRMCLTSAKVSHVNVSRFGSFVYGQYNGGRSFGGHRAAESHWSAPRRILQAAAAPLVPLLRIRRILAHVRACGRTGQLIPRMLPTLFLGLAAHATGEAAGYLFGSGQAARRKSDLEYHRDHHVSTRDRLSMEF
jgi:hypothetical protein